MPVFSSAGYLIPDMQSPTPEDSRANYLKGNFIVNGLIL